MVAQAKLKLKYGGKEFDVKTDLLRKQTIMPLLSINNSAEKDKDGNILSVNNSLQFESFILGSSVVGTMSGYKAVLDYFTDSDKQNTTLEIICDTNGIISSLASFQGTKFISSNFDKSSNNWVVTIPYSITLESSTIKNSGDPLIESYDDNWTIEPLEEVSYFNKIIDTKYRALKTPGPLTATPGSGDLKEVMTPMKMENFLQYRITHRVSAVGKPIDRTDPNNPLPAQNVTTTNKGKSSAYQEAARWVMQRTNSVFDHVVAPNQPTGINLYNLTPQSNGPATFVLHTGMRLYNHIRSIESSPSAGSYGITDTWLALGTGIKYTEEFSWEISTSEELDKNVTLNGTIKGLEEAKNTYSLFPHSGGYPAATGNIVNMFSPLFQNQTNSNNKFNNALEAYISGIRPYLYHRASMALSASMYNSTDTRSTPEKSIWINDADNVYLGVRPISYTETLNPAGGSISYNIVYSTRNSLVTSGAISSTINLVDNYSSEVVAETFVLGRILGPILEKVGYTKNERRLTIESVFPKAKTLTLNKIHPQSPSCPIYHKGQNKSPQYKDIENIVNEFKPVGPLKAFGSLDPAAVSYPISTNGLVFVTSNSQSWNPFEGRFSWDITWIYSTGC